MPTVPEQLRAALGESLIDIDEQSLHPWSSVHRATVVTVAGEREVVIKRTWSSESGRAALAEWQHALLAAGVATVGPIEGLTGAWPVEIDDDVYTAYPFVDGRSWRADRADIAAAGRLLGEVHAASVGLEFDGFPELEWPEHDQESIDEDVEAAGAAFDEQLPEATAERERWLTWLRTFPERTLPIIRDGGLPTYPVSMDHRASNLVYTEQGPVLIDLENAERAPRLLDLAASVLLFSSEATPSLGRLFDEDEWAAFLTAYRETAPEFTDDEVVVWPVAVRYMLCEWGTWHIADGAEWDFPGEHGVLTDLMRTGDDRFPLG